MADQQSTSPDLVCLTQEEWSQMEECSAALTGLVRLFQSGDVEEGGAQLLYTFHYRFDRLMAAIANRLYKEEQARSASDE